MDSTSPQAVEDLARLVRTDPDPRVRHRAQAVRLVVDGQSIRHVAKLFHTSPHRVRTWRTRFLTGGRTGLADEPRTGRPPKLRAAELALLTEALERGPQAYGWPVTVWSLRDLGELLRQRRGVRVCATTIQRALHGLGYAYRRPRHELKHRQDHDAVAAAAEVLAWLGKGPAPSPLPSAWSTWMNAKSTAIPGWRKSGSGAGSR